MQTSHVRGQESWRKGSVPCPLSRGRKTLSSNLGLAPVHNEGTGSLGNSSTFKIIQSIWVPSKRYEYFILHADAGKCWSTFSKAANFVMLPLYFFRGNQWKKIESSGKHIYNATGVGPQHPQHVPQQPVPTADLRATTSYEQRYSPFRLYLH